MRILTPKQQKLAEENHKLIYAFMNKHHLDHDEYYGDMAEAYCIAIAAFDETKGSLSTLVYHAMKNRLRNIRRCQSLPRRIPSDCLLSLDELQTDAELVWSFYHCIPDPKTDVERIALHNIALQKLTKECSAEELELILSSVNKTVTQREAAKRLGISQTTYCRRVKAAKEKALRIVLEVLDSV